MHQNTRISYEENPPQCISQNSDSINLIKKRKRKKKTVLENVDISSGSRKLIQLKILLKALFNSLVAFTPYTNKSNYAMFSSLHSPGNSDIILVHNINTKLIIRKGTKIESMEHRNDEEVICLKENEIFQINNINLSKIHKLGHPIYKVLQKDKISKIS